MDIATFKSGDSTMLLLAILTMIAIVFSMNKLVWRPLQKRAIVKYRLEV
jgi:ABC-type anion transport system duplicated permease subunit